MKKIAFPLLWSLLVLFGCGSESAKELINDGDVSNNTINQLWNKTVSQLLVDDLWLENYKYDASHVLMLPLHYAFIKNDIEKKYELDSFFERASFFLGDWNNSSTLYNTQFSYFAARYLYLSKVSGNWSWFHQQIYEHLLDYSKALWLKEGAWHWSEGIFNGFKERIYWKINHKNTEYKFYQAIVDEEFFLLGIASELLKIATIEGHRSEYNFLLEISDFSYSLFLESVEKDLDGFWYFQKGGWFDHSTHLYSGHAFLEPNLEPFPDEGGVYDSSHAHRLPLILISLLEESINSKGQAKTIYYSKLLNEFNELFQAKILQAFDNQVKAPLINNYLDGHNGVYLYSPKRFPQKLGYGPSQLSGILTLSWYSFLNSPTLKHQFSQMSFPLSEAAITYYLGPSTKRERHPLLKWPDYFDNGFAELYVNISRDVDYPLFVFKRR